MGKKQEERKPRQRKAKAPAERQDKKGRSFPYKPLIYTVICVICGVCAWQNWVVIAPIVPSIPRLLSALSGGEDGFGEGTEPSAGDMEALAVMQSIKDPQSLIFTFLWFLGLAIACVSFLVAALINWVRWARNT